MSVIGDARDLQQVLNSVYAGAVKECEGREHEGKLVGNGHHMAQAIVENVKIELLKRGLFVKFEGPPPDQGPSRTEDDPYAESRRFAGYSDSWEAREAEARLQRYGSTMHAKDSEEYERIKPLVPRESSFGELAEKNKAAGGCGCAPGTIICPH